MRVIVLLMALFQISYANADGVFPYSTRTKDYSGWSSSLRGDINSVGMGGATVAIPYSISAGQINPAGFAMSTASVAISTISNTIQDPHLQQSNTKYDTHQWGVSVSPAPWGFGVTYYSPTTESGKYTSPTTGNTLTTEVSVQQLHFAIARAFFENQLSIGLSLGFAKAVRQIGSYAYNNTSMDMELGALYRLPDHLMIGSSFIPQDTIAPSSDYYPQSDMPGFNQSIISPAQWVNGIGWIPNRYFKVGFSLSYIGAIKNAALLADQNKNVGDRATFQPRLGASYVLAHYDHLEINYSAGTYFEPSRIQGEANRIHGTMGIEVNPWFLNTGIGFDLAGNYKNLMIAVGLDIVRTARAFGLVPENNSKPYQGFFPPPLEVHAEGLPSGLTHGEDSDDAPAVSIEEIVKILRDIPDRILEKAQPDEEPPPPPQKKKKKLKLNSTRF